MPSGHPECPSRSQALIEMFETTLPAGVQRHKAPTGNEQLFSLVHTPAHIAAIQQAAERQAIEGGFIALDADTLIGAGSYQAASQAVGAAVTAIDMIMDDLARNAFIAARPPGHHAEPDRAMGFCLFNSAAIAASYARRMHDCQHIAVVDFDVHHGNGTQAAFWHEEHAFFASSHEFPQYPGTGLTTEGGAYGTIVNAPLATGSGSSAFRDAWQQRLLPALDRFQPDFIVISAGFDGHRDDPLGGLNLHEEDFSWITKEITALANRHCRGRVLSMLEGGYNINALRKSVFAHVKTLASHG